MSIRGPEIGNVKWPSACVARGLSRPDFGGSEKYQIQEHDTINDANMTLYDLQGPRVEV